MKTYKVNLKLPEPKQSLPLVPEDMYFAKKIPENKKESWGNIDLDNLITPELKRNLEPFPGESLVEKILDIFDAGTSDSDKLDMIYSELSDLSSISSEDIFSHPLTEREV